MPVSADTLQALIAAGVTGDALVAVVRSIDADMTAAQPVLVVPIASKQAAARRTARYRSRRGLSESAWLRLRARLLRRDRHICAYCNATGADHCDHVVPLAKGGTNDETNLVAACSLCNQSKGDRTIKEWRPSHGPQS